MTIIGLFFLIALWWAAWAASNLTGNGAWFFGAFFVTVALVGFRVWQISYIRRSEREFNDYLSAAQAKEDRLLQATVLWHKNVSASASDLMSDVKFAFVRYPDGEEGWLVFSGRRDGLHFWDKHTITMELLPVIAEESGYPQTSWREVALSDWKMLGQD